MRFLFCGFDRETGKPIDGHVEASDTEAAYRVLSDRGIVTETLRDDPRPPFASPDRSVVSQFADTLEDALRSALDSSVSQVPFDDLTARYRGKKVRVIDRDKIRHQVAQVVDTALAASEANLESSTTARERVADAIDGLFHDPRNISSEQNAQSSAKLHSSVASTGPSANGTAAATTEGLAEQIGRLSGVVEHAESLIAAMQAALRNVESGGAPVPRRRLIAISPSITAEQNGVLREIFQSNLELRRVGAKTSQALVNATGTD